MKKLMSTLAVVLVALMVASTAFAQTETPTPGNDKGSSAKQPKDVQSPSKADTSATDTGSPAASPKTGDRERSAPPQADLSEDTGAAEPLTAPAADGRPDSLRPSFFALQGIGCVSYFPVRNGLRVTRCCGRGRPAEAPPLAFGLSIGDRRSSGRRCAGGGGRDRIEGAVGGKAEERAIPS